MENVFSIDKKIINEVYDIVVVGGGLSGVMAAISGAREGKSVIIIEKNGFLGGMATAGLINPFMSYCERGTKTIANAGLFQVLLDKMYKTGALKFPDSRTFREQLLKFVLDDFIAEYGIKVLFHTYMSGVKCENGKIDCITVSCVSGNIKIKGKFFVDATGDGNVFAFANFPYYLRSGEKNYCQPMSTCFNLCNVDWSKYDDKKVNKLYRQFKSEGKINNPRENVLVFDSPIKNLMHFNTTRIIKKNPCDVEELSEAEIIGRQQILEIVNFLKNNIDGFQNSELINIADDIGIRESRRVQGLYTVTEEDILSTTKFKDSIARGTYDIDIHNPNGEGTTIKRIPCNDYYTIPLRSLIPIESKNLIVVGRCISSTHEAHSSLRVMPIAACIGEAAGIACAIACENNIQIKQVDIDVLHKKLDKYNALY